MVDPIFDHEILDVDRLAVEYVVDRLDVVLAEVPTPYRIMAPSITITSTTRARDLVSDLLPRTGVQRVVQAGTNG